MVLAQASAIIERAHHAADLRPVVASFFDEATNSVSHVAHDVGTRAAAIIDPVLDIDAARAGSAGRSAEAIVAHVRRLSLTVEWIFETHIHADHVSAAAWLQRQVGGRTGIGAGVLRMLGAEMSRFDRLFADGDAIELGGLEGVALHAPGHTPADVAFVIGNAVFTGDTLFMPDFGTARADFPGGDAELLYRSARRLLALSPHARLLHCHDYLVAGRSRHVWESTIAEQRRANVHVRDGRDQQAFVAMRMARDAALPAPALMSLAVPINLRAGQMSGETAAVAENPRILLQVVPGAELGRG